MKSPPIYTGRFAPSPSGRLHFGSLVTALASYLDARAHQGTWLVRMEDLDPPREEEGAASAILHTLEAHGLHWDHSVIYQSQRLEQYDVLLQALLDKQLAYACDCNRQRLMQLQGIYDGNCRAHPPASDSACAYRLKLYDLPQASGAVTNNIQLLDDRIQGRTEQNLRTQAGDQIIKRRDGLHGYTLAVMYDDIEQGITDIVRGADFLSITPRHLGIYEIFANFGILPCTAPRYAHVPLVMSEDGYKLSKQNRAPALDNSCAGENLFNALEFLQQAPPLHLKGESPSAIVDWGIRHWNLEALRQSSAAAVKE